jgi:hypothetical protein
MKKRTSPQVKLTLNEYASIIRKNQDQDSVLYLMKIMSDFADMNSIDVKEAISFLFSMNPMITITPGKFEFKIKNICDVKDEFYGYKHYKSLVD